MLSGVHRGVCRGMCRGVHRGMNRAIRKGADKVCVRAHLGMCLELAMCVGVC